MEPSWFEAAETHVPDTPSVVIDTSRLDANIAAVSTAAARAGKRVRPHVKTHKMVGIARRQLAAGAVGLQVAKLGEAEVMLAADPVDILVAYPIVGAEKLCRFAALSERVRTSMSLDDYAVARHASDALVAAGASANVVIEIDTGLRRVGVAARDAGSLAEKVSQLPHLTVTGIMTHEGHVGPRMRSGANAADLVADAVAAMRLARDGLIAAGVRRPLVSMGSSVTWRHLITHAEVDEIRPGLYVFYDMNSLRAGAATLDDIACAVIATVVSTHCERGEFVVDAGAKTLSGAPTALADGTTSYGHLPRFGAEVVRVSEEHGVVAADHIPDVGARVLIVPNHVCPVVDLADVVIAFEADGSWARWRVDARGQVQ